MYAWIWRHLPGGTIARAMTAAVLAAAVIVALFAWVFPWAEQALPWLDVTVEVTGDG